VLYEQCVNSSGRSFPARGHCTAVDRHLVCRAGAALAPWQTDRRP